MAHLIALVVGLNSLVQKESLVLELNEKKNACFVVLFTVLQHVIEAN